MNGKEERKAGTLHSILPDAELYATRAVVLYLKKKKDYLILVYFLCLR